MIVRHFSNLGLFWSKKGCLLFNGFSRKYKSTSDKITDLTKSKRIEQSLKRTKFKTKRSTDLIDKLGYACVSYCTGDDIDIVKLKSTLGSAYDIDRVDSNDSENVYVVSEKGRSEPELINFIFPDLGAFVTWEFDELKSLKILNCVKQCQRVIHNDEFINNELEKIEIIYKNEGETTFSKGIATISLESKTKLLEKVAVSHSLALSVKLSEYENMMVKLIESIIHVPENLKNGTPTELSRSDVLRKLGEIESLRLLVNLDSDFLNLHTFYWDYDDVSHLFIDLCEYLGVEDRTHSLNQKLQYCNEIIDLLQRHLSEKHGHRLEWLIIVLILAEVVMGIHGKL